METELPKILAASGALVVGVVLLSGLATGTHYAITTADAICDRPSPASPPPTTQSGLPELAASRCARFMGMSAPPQEPYGAERGLIAVQAALRMRGVPYSWGGGGPDGPSFGIGRGARTRGFDCSGLAEYAWAKAGVRIGGHTATQWKTGSRVPREQIRPGDLIFFAHDYRDPATIHHVGIVIDTTRMVHAPHTGSSVRIDRWIGVPGWEREFIGVIRPTGIASRKR